MNTRKIIATILFTFSMLMVIAQHKALTIQDGIRRGLTIPHLDSIYQSAVHVDSSQAVFKTEEEQQAMGDAYMKLLQDFGKFLTANNFMWGKPMRAFNRIYFNSDGTIDYFLYNFQNTSGKHEDELSDEKLAEFNRLLNLFIRDYRISLMAKVKFAQCSPATYMPVDDK